MSKQDDTKLEPRNTTGTTILIVVLTILTSTVFANVMTEIELLEQKVLLLQDRIEILEASRR